MEKEATIKKCVPFETYNGKEYAYSHFARPRREDIYLEDNRIGILSRKLKECDFDGNTDFRIDEGKRAIYVLTNKSKLLDEIKSKLNTQEIKTLQNILQILT